MFNTAKIQLENNSVSYLSHILSNKGIEPDPEKIKTITEYLVPKSHEDLQRFLGMVTYLAKFTSSSLKFDTFAKTTFEARYPIALK